MHLAILGAQAVLTCCLGRVTVSLCCESAWAEGRVCGSHACPALCVNIIATYISDLLHLNTAGIEVLILRFALCIHIRVVSTLWHPIMVMHAASGTFFL